MSNLDKTPKQILAYIARHLGLKGHTTDELVDAYINFLVELNRAIQIPLNIQKYGTDEELFKQNLDRISTNAVEDECTGCNQRLTTKEDFKKLFTAIYYRRQVDF
ncbi:MAG: iron-containing alcohol dehydrogenase [Bacteroidales bacterium]|nr:iron-containing alcohol dehydrogenase [Bacteroidales bacterium]